MMWLKGCVLAVVVVLVVCQDQECETKKDMRSRAAYPNPMNATDVAKKLCGRNKLSHICDPDCIITVDQADHLDNVIENIERRIDCPCASQYCSQLDPRGYRFGIALLLKMEKDENMLDVPDDTSGSIGNGRLFAYTLEQRWEWGQCSEDIVIFFSLYDSVVYTITGRETAKKLKPSMVGEISMKWRKFFGEGQYIYKGFEGMINDYRDILVGNYTSGIKRVDPPRTAAVIGGNSAGTRSLFSVTSLAISFILALLAFS